MDLAGKRIFITGATGFIGGRLAERFILEHGLQARALVRNFARASRLARLPVEMVGGDILDPESLIQAISGCEVVFHCAYGNTGDSRFQRRVNVEGTENVIKAALKHEVQRFVHISTVSVYGPCANGEVDETRPYKYSKNVYADSKIDAEKLAFRYHREQDLPLVVLQPTVVYGPYAPSWTIGPVQQIKSGRLILVEGGVGCCNSLYIDNLVDALYLAATRDEAVGERFIISDGDPVAWREFFGAYSRMCSQQPLRSLTISDVRSLRREQRRKRRTWNQIITGLRKRPDIRRAILRLPPIRSLRKVGQKVLPYSIKRYAKSRLVGQLSDGHNVDDHDSIEEVNIPDDDQTAFFTSGARYRIDKAQKLLGYEPTTSFAQGMRLTEAWLRFSRLV